MLENKKKEEKDSEVIFD